MRISDWSSDVCSSDLQKAWIQERIEGRDKEVQFTEQGKKAILNKLIEGEIFERFCHMKFTGTKRFGLEGGEALIPAMEAIIKRGGQLGDRKSTRLNSSHYCASRMPSAA